MYVTSPMDIHLRWRGVECVEQEANSRLWWTSHLTYRIYIQCNRAERRERANAKINSSHAATCKTLQRPMMKLCRNLNMYAYGRQGGAGGHVTFPLTSTFPRRLRLKGSRRPKQSSLVDWRANHWFGQNSKPYPRRLRQTDQNLAGHWEHVIRCSPKHGIMSSFSAGLPVQTPAIRVRPKYMIIGNDWRTRNLSERCACCSSSCLWSESRA